MAAPALGDGPDGPKVMIFTDYYTIYLPKEWADTCLLVLPCGRSAHTEAGWMKGSGKRTLVYIPEMQEPELMYKLFDLVSGSMTEILDFLK